MNVVAAVLFCSILSSDPPLYAVSEKVDLIEINHYYDSHGSFVLDQAIFYVWSAEQIRFEVVDYKLMKTPGQHPRPQISGDYFSAWHDGHVLRYLYSSSFLETWTQHDPEHQARQRLAHEYRRGLARVPGIAGHSTR